MILSIETIYCATIRSINAAYRARDLERAMWLEGHAMTLAYLYGST